NSQNWRRSCGVALERADMERSGSVRRAKVFAFASPAGGRGCPKGWRGCFSMDRKHDSGAAPPRSLSRLRYPPPHAGEGAVMELPALALFEHRIVHAVEVA